MWSVFAPALPSSKAKSIYISVVKHDFKSVFSFCLKLILGLSLPTQMAWLHLFLCALKLPFENEPFGSSFRFEKQSRKQEGPDNTYWVVECLSFFVRCGRIQNHWFLFDPGGTRFLRWIGWYEFTSCNCPGSRSSGWCAYFLNQHSFTVTGFCHSVVFLKSWCLLNLRQPTPKIVLWIAVANSIWWNKIFWPWINFRQTIQVCTFSLDENIPKQDTCAASSFSFFSFFRFGYIFSFVSDQEASLWTWQVHFWPILTQTVLSAEAFLVPACRNCSRVLLLMHQPHGVSTTLSITAMPENRELKKMKFSFFPALSTSSDIFVVTYRVTNFFAKTRWHAIIFIFYGKNWVFIFLNSPISGDASIIPPTPDPDPPDNGRPPLPDMTWSHDGLSGYHVNQCFVSFNIEMGKSIIDRSSVCALNLYAPSQWRNTQAAFCETEFKCIGIATVFEWKAKVFSSIHRRQGLWNHKCWT